MATGWTPTFPAERLREAGDSLAAAVACNGRDRHPLTVSLVRAAGLGVTGLASIALYAHLHLYGRGFGAGIALATAPAFVFLFNRWVDGPVLYYRNWGRLHRLELTTVSAVEAKSQAGAVSLVLSAPGLRKPLRIGLRSRGYVMSGGARDHLHGWLSAPQVHWAPEARALLDAHGTPATWAVRRRHRVLLAVLAYGLPLAIFGVGLWHLHRQERARAIAGAPGYRRFGGPHGKLLAVGRPWGRPCQPIRFAVDSRTPGSAYSQIQSVVIEARREGLDVALETRSFRWDPSVFYFVGGQSAATTVEVDIYAHDETPPRLSNGRPEHINLRWDARLDPDGHHEDLTVAEADLFMQTVADDPLALRRSIRQLIAMTQGIIGTTRRDSGIASNSSTDRFTPADIAAMQRMSGCPRTA